MNVCTAPGSLAASTPWRIRNVTRSPSRECASSVAFLPPMSVRRSVRNALSTRVPNTSPAATVNVDRCSRLVAMRRRLPLEPMTSLPLGADGIVARSAVPLSGYTTLRLGGPAAQFVAAGSVADEGFDGTFVQVANSGSKIDSLGDGRVALTVEAGEDWDAVVCRTVEAGL